MPPISLPLRSRVLRIVFFPIAAMTAAPARSPSPAFLTIRDDRLPGRPKNAQSISEVLRMQQYMKLRNGLVLRVWFFPLATGVGVVSGPGKRRESLPIAMRLFAQHRRQAWLQLLALDQISWSSTCSARLNCIQFRTCGGPIHMVRRQVEARDPLLFRRKHHLLDYRTPDPVVYRNACRIGRAASSTQV